MYKKNLFIVNVSLMLLIVMVSAWLIYSIVHFDGFFPPNKLFLGLITPDKYYQENVGNFLLNNGSELEINSINMTSWNIYQDDEYGFTFKYSDEFFVKKQSRFVRLVCYKDEQLNCPIYINVHGNVSKIAFSVIQDIKNDI